MSSFLIISKLSPSPETLRQSFRAETQHAKPNKFFFFYKFLLKYNEWLIVKIKWNEFTRSFLDLQNVFVVKHQRANKHSCTLEEQTSAFAHRVPLKAARLEKKQAHSPVPEFLRNLCLHLTKLCTVKDRPTFLRWKVKLSILSSHMQLYLAFKLIHLNQYESLHVFAHRTLAIETIEICLFRDFFFL